MTALSDEVKVAFFLSFIITLLSEFLIKFTDINTIFSALDFILIPMDASILDIEKLRAWIYILLMYLTTYPILFFRMRSHTSDVPTPFLPISKIVLPTIMCLIFTILIFLMPFILMIIGEDSIGRAGGFYTIFIGSIFGLIIAGALMFYAMSLFAFCLFVIMPKLWILSIRGDNSK